MNQEEKITLYQRFKKAFETYLDSTDIVSEHSLDREQFTILLRLPNGFYIEYPNGRSDIESIMTKMRSEISHLGYWNGHGLSGDMIEGIAYGLNEFDLEHVGRFEAGVAALKEQKLAGQNEKQEKFVENEISGLLDRLGGYAEKYPKYAKDIAMQLQKKTIEIDPESQKRSGGFTGKFGEKSSGFSNSLG